METMLLYTCPSCGRTVDEGKCCEREAWLMRRRELLHDILTGMGIKLEAVGSVVLLADATSGHLIQLHREGDED